MLIKVLLAGISEHDALLILDVLVQGGYQPVHAKVDNLEDMAKALESEQWEIVISDYDMNRFSALDVLKLIQQKRLDLPLIVVTEKTGEDSAVEAIKAGINDYITKGNLKRLVPAIRREIKEVAICRDKRQVQITLSKNKRYRFLESTNKCRHAGEKTHNVCSLKNSSAIEEAIARISSFFISTKGANLSIVLRILGELFHANRAYIFQIDDNTSQLNNTYIWQQDNKGPQKLKFLDASLFPWWMDRLNRKESINISNVELLPAKATAEKEFLKSQGVVSCLVVPIFLTTGKLFGFIGIDSTKKNTALVQ